MVANQECDENGEGGIIEFCKLCYRGPSVKDVLTLGRKGVSNYADKSGQGGFNCMWTSFSVWFLEERRGHLMVILSSSSYVKD